MLEKLYKERCEKITDINQHLPVLRDLASKVEFVTEFGVREGNSTVAFASAKPRALVSYDIHPMPDDLETLLSQLPYFKFIKANVLHVKIHPTDLLFIDTYHSYEQLTMELDIHSLWVNRFIVLHDTEAFGIVGEDGKKPGLQKAVSQLIDKGEWFRSLELKNNNGLTVLARR